MTEPIRIRRRPVPAANGPDNPLVSEQDPAAMGLADPAEEASGRAEPDQASSYDVGYGKPPRNTRFQAGQSGNPRGRPKGSCPINTLVSRELDQLVTVRENGQTRRIRKRELMTKQLVKKAAEGDFKALGLILRMEADSRGHDDPATSGNLEDSAFTPERDREILAQFMATQGKGDTEPSDEDEDPEQ